MLLKSIRKFLFLLLILSAVVIIFLSLLGYLSFIIVLTGSMEPTVPRGSLAVVFKSNDYGVGDVVLFKAYDRLILHRIIDSVEGYFLTKGDASASRDAWKLTNDNIVGELYMVIPNLGFVLSGLRKPLIFALLTTLIYLLFELSSYKSPKNVCEKRTVALTGNENSGF
ncbi:MAG: signal peptidase I [Candidatus Bathyarchaeia archaeon]